MGYDILGLVLEETEKWLEWLHQRVFYHNMYAEKVEKQQQNDNGSFHYSRGNSKNDQEDIV